MEYLQGVENMLTAASFLFAPENIRVIVEVFILFLGIYGVLYYTHNTFASAIFAALVFLWVGLGLLCWVCELSILEHLIEVIGNSLVVILVIIFQPEVRRLLAQLGSYMLRLKTIRTEIVGDIVAAADSMANLKCGALIVVEKRLPLQMLINDSVPLDIPVSAHMLKSIFDSSQSPLHDGAVIIRDDRIVAARAILPLARAEHISRQLGTRHRAALGMSETSDAVIVVVSEETGIISIAYNGRLFRGFEKQDLRSVLSLMLSAKEREKLTEALFSDAVRAEARSDS